MEIPVSHISCQMKALFVKQGKKQAYIAKQLHLNLKAIVKIVLTYSFFLVLFSKIQTISNIALTYIKPEISVPS